MNYLRSFQYVNVSPARYFLVYTAPMVAASVFVSYLLVVTLRPIMPGWLEVLLPFLIVGLVTTFLVVYPVAQADNRRMGINQAIPFFMTHFGVLSTSSLPRQEIFRVLGERKEYGPLAEELYKIYRLSAQWNMPLPQACRFVGVSTPSQILTDFLDRLAQTLETGQDLETFLRYEQQVVMKEYATVYETSNHHIVSLKDTYASLVMSGVFFAIFAIIAPVISDIDPTQIFTGILVMFIFIEMLVLYLFRFRVPSDHLWHQLSLPTKHKQTARVLLVLCAAAAVALFTVLFPFHSIPLSIKAAVAFTPLGAVGVFHEVEERRIKRREDNYGAFIRSVGTSVEARGGNFREVLRRIRKHDFGPLGHMVNNLYARVTWRLHDLLAWRHFAAESGSNLVAQFNEMFVESIRAGGRGGPTGALISENVHRILNLRRGRYATAGILRGLLVGLTASVAFTLFIGVGVLEVLSNLLGNGESDPSINPITLHFTADVTIIENLLLIVIIVHALAGAMMLKVVDGGSYVGGLAYFVLFVWIGVALGLGSEEVVHQIFGTIGSR
jgi:archaeal flagellar protein FlaJ